MEKEVIAAIIGAGGMAMVAVITAVVSIFAANRKLKELELTHQQKLAEVEADYAHKRRDMHLQNAKALVKDIYIPINLALTELSNSYQAFRTHVELDVASAPEIELDKFRSACFSYLEKIDELVNKGADAYLITDLDEELRSFNTFIRQSVYAKEVTRKVVLQLQAPILGSFAPVTAVTTERLGKLGLPWISLNLGFVAFAFSETEVLAAPLASRRFEERIQIQIAALKFLIKEVTLGGSSP